MDWFRPAVGEGTRTALQGTGQAATVMALLPYEKDSTTLPKLQCLEEEIICFLSDA